MKSILMGALAAVLAGLVPAASDGSVMVPVFTDFRLHSLTPLFPAKTVEILNQMARPGTTQFSSGNSMFVTKKLWGATNEKPFFSHSKFTTFREAIANHFGKADISRRRFFKDLNPCEQGALVEYLKTFQVLDPRRLVAEDRVAARFALIVDESYEAKPWPPEDADGRAADARNECWNHS